MRHRIMERVLGLERLFKATVIVIARSVKMIQTVTSAILILGGKGAMRCNATSHMLSRPQSPCAEGLLRTMPGLREGIEM